MDIITHAILAWVLARGFFSRRGWGVSAGMILAGTLADFDGTSAWFGAGAYLRWHGTYTHSLPGTLLFVAIGTIAALRWEKHDVSADSAKHARDWKKSSGIALAIAMAVLAHLAMDMCQSGGVTLLSPFFGRRFALDILPGIDPWILALLILGIVVPELFLLVGTEIGVRDKKPRGSNGARVVLALILIYVMGRAVLHTNAITQMDAHAYKGETPRRVGAFADSLSVFKWHGIAETTSLMCMAEVEVGPGQVFDADAAYCQHKPDASEVLATSEKSAAAQRFLRVARFPKATVEKLEDGYEVQIRAAQNEGESETRQRVAARILLDDKPRVVEDELVWSKDLGRR